MTDNDDKRESDTAAPEPDSGKEIDTQLQKDPVRRWTRFHCLSIPVFDRALSDR